MSTPAAQSPLWWLEKLSAELVARQPTMLLMDSYYRGDHPLPFLTKAHKDKIQSEFRQMLDDSRSNFMRLVVDVVEERLAVEGFRLSANDDTAADEASWRIWQANQMDSEAPAAFVESLVKGVSYVSVWSGERPDDFPVIAVEDPLQTIVGYEPGSNFRRRAAALKVWRDDWTGMDRANVYLPGGIFKYQRVSVDGSVATSNTLGSDGSIVRGGSRRRSGVSQPAWEPLDGDGFFVENPVGVVPIVPLRNRPRVMVEGESELADVYRVQNQINGFLFLLALAGYFGAHRQRWVTGIKLSDEDGKAVEPFDVAIDRLLATENPQASFGDFQQTDLSGYLKALEQKVQHIAVTTRTPRHYLLPEGQEPSGDSIRGAEAGLVKKVERKQRPFGEGLEEAIRLARRFQGETDAPVDSEIEWVSAEVRSEGERTDAAIKRFASRLTTWEQTLEDLGYTPQQISRMLQAFGGVPPDPAAVEVPPAA